MPYNVKERQELVFAEVPLVGTNWTYPITADRIWDSFETYASELLDDADQTAWEYMLAHCAFDITVFNSYTSEVIDKHLNRRFPVFSQLVNFVNGLPNGGGFFSVDCTAKVYSVIDNSIPRINRMFAFNKFYSCLLGTAKARKDRHSANSLYNALDPEDLQDDINHTRAFFKMPLNHASMEQFVTAAWQNVWGITPGAGGYDGYNDDDVSRRNWLSTIWFQTQKDRATLYNLPATGVGLSIEQGHQLGLVNPIPGRTVVDVSGTSVSDHANTMEHFLIEKYAICEIPAVDKITDSGSGNWLQDSAFKWFNSITDMAARWHGLGSGSAIVVYGVQSGDRRALYIKPYAGADTFCFPKIDTSLYRLEMVSTYPQKRDKFTVVDLGSLGTPMGHWLMQYRLPRSMFWSGVSHSSDWTRRGNVDAKHKFYLRRLGTEFVSPLSDYFIHSYFSSIGKRFSCITTLLESVR